MSESGCDLFIAFPIDPPRHFRRLELNSLPLVIGLELAHACACRQGAAHRIDHAEACVEAPKFERCVQNADGEHDSEPHEDCAAPRRIRSDDQLVE
jgi:hypothetical protein